MDSWAGIGWQRRGSAARVKGGIRPCAGSSSCSTNGALVIDNPGMRELGVLGAESGIEASYADIVALSARCRFRDCSHANEPGCAVRAALESGELDAGHYENFLKLESESAVPADVLCREAQEGEGLRQVHQVRQEAAARTKS